MKNKKSTVTIELVIIIALTLFIAFILAVIIPKLLGKSGGEASGFLDLSADYDEDGITNFEDKCDCKAGEEENEGCPVNMQIKGIEASRREEECHEKYVQK